MSWIWTSALRITSLLSYNPRLYQLSYRRFEERERHFIWCELLVHNAFVKKKNDDNFTPSGRIWTSDLWITNLLYYSPPLYQLSYRRFDDHEWHFISCELLVHNAFVKKKRWYFTPSSRIWTSDLQTCFTTVTALPTELLKVWRTW